MDEQKFERVAIVGNSFRDKESIEAYDNIAVGDFMFYRAEPDNQYDSNAIQLWTESRIFVGYVSADMAKLISPLILNGVNFEVEVDGWVTINSGGYKSVQFIQLG